MRRLLPLIVIFIVLPLVELYVIYKVGDAIGVVPTILILAADSVLGALLLRSQGRAVWGRFNTALTEGRVPHREVVDGVLVIFGGAFLITPGFVTDIFGLFLLLPPTRAVARRIAMKRIGRRVEAAATGADKQTRRRRRPPRGRYDVEGTATEYDAPPPRLER
jgi:UPF0716 protein FxsA